MLRVGLLRLSGVRDETGGAGDGGAVGGCVGTGGDGGGGDGPLTCSIETSKPDTSCTDTLSAVDSAVLDVVWSVLIMLCASLEPSELIQACTMTLPEVTVNLISDADVPECRLARFDRNASVSKLLISVSMENEARTTWR